jgi:O-antigen/teichoic acid export membrane protein
MTVVNQSEKAYGVFSRARYWLGRAGTEFGGDSARLAAGIVLAQAILFGATPIVSRLYGPAVFGTAARVLAIVAVSSVIATGRFELAIMLPASRAAGYAVFCLSSAVACVGAIAASVVIVVLRPWHSFGALSWALPLGLVINGVSTASAYWLLRDRSFSRVATGRVASSLLTVGMQIGLGLAGAPVAWVLIAATIVGPGVMIVLAFSGSNRASLHARPAWRDLCSAARDYRRFPLVEAGGALLGTLGLQLPVLLLSVWYPAASVGAFFMAQRLLTAPVSLMGAAVGQVFFQRASERMREGRELWSLTFSLFKRLVLVGFVPMSVVLVFGRPLFTWLLGPSWVDAGRFAQLLAPSTFFQLTFVPLCTLFAVMQRQGSALIIHLLIFSVPFAALVAGRTLFHGEVFPMIALLGISSGLLYFCLSMWNLALARSRARVEEPLGIP